MSIRNLINHICNKFLLNVWQIQQKDAGDATSEEEENTATPSQKKARISGETQPDSANSEGNLSLSVIWHAVV